MIYSTLLLLTSLLFTPTPSCDNFTVDNESSYAIGIVSVMGSGGPVPLNVPDPGLYSDTLCFTPTGVVINGQLVTYPDTAIVTLPSESKVKILWESTQLVDIRNQQLQDGPMQ